MNLSWSRKILEALCAEGVEDFVFCAGARNSPLVVTLDKCYGIKAYSFFEERSAAFFALGLSRASGRPTAVVTTSGTAVANLLPATVEAFHTGVPLILVTADRPRRLRGTGAPQAIDQTGIFAKFVDKEFDLELGEMPSFAGWRRRSPIHLNICFDEPLIDEKHEPFSLRAASVDSFAGVSYSGKTQKADEAAAFVREFLDDSMMVLVGTLETPREREAVRGFLQNLKAPTYFEGTSGLREEKFDFALRGGDKVLPLALKKYGIRKVLRIGGVPTARVWRDLEEGQAEVLSVSPLPFAGLSRGTFICTDLANLFGGQWGGLKPSPHLNPDLMEFDRSISLKLEKLLRDEPLSEPALLRALSEKIPSKDLVYVGNSLPIREWDLAASYHHPRAIEANRGVNGIDGQLSTYFGLARESNFCIVGDLTAMYDLSSPWALGQKKMGATCIVVVNNGGGKIFNRIFNNELFENRHTFDFSNWAAQWRLSYEKWTEVPKTLSVCSKPMVIELVPDEEATKRFWDGYDGLFK